MIDILIKGINLVILSLGNSLQSLVNLLPASPFSMIDNSPIVEYLPTINYFIPISAMIGIAQVWLSAIVVYYIYQIVLRWIKAIE